MNTLKRKAEQLSVETRQPSKQCGGNGRCLEKQSDQTYKLHSKWICEFSCQVQKCPNFEVCKKIAPKWYFDDRNGLCQVCLDQFGCKLKMVSNVKSDDCGVCYEAPAYLVEFPAECHHLFCGDCVAKLVFFDESRYHLSPVPFGCPTCPNECKNPIRGRQCGCYEYDEVIEEWMSENTSDSMRWQNAEFDSIENFEDMSYGTKKCPLCRKRVENH